MLSYQDYMNPLFHSVSPRAILALSILTVGTAASLRAAPNVPVYTNTFGDAVTGDNQFRGSDGKLHYDVDAGADKYQFEMYERPTTQTFSYVDGRYATTGDYWGNLDIVQAKSGFDNTYYYGQIDMFGLTKIDSGGGISQEGLVYQYGIRLSTDPDGRNGFLFIVDDPAHKNNPTQWNGDKSFGFKDSDGDVGGAAQVKGNGGPTGLSVTKEDNPEEQHNLNGYDQVIISDGKLEGSGQNVLFTRINPSDASIVEFAIDYKALGLTQADLAALGYLDFESNKGLQDNQNYFWNDKYTKSEAGSPNGGPGGLSEFGTQGTGNIYELDTIRGFTVIPEVGALLPLATMLGLLGSSRRPWRRKSAA